MEIKKCSKCGASIVLIKTKDKRKIACEVQKVDYQRNFKANKIIVEDDGEVIRGEVVKNKPTGLQKITDGNGYLAHCQVCQGCQKENNQ